MNETPVKSCCFSGHRPEKMPFQAGPHSFGYYRFLQELEKTVHEAILEGFSHFITGMSRGMDLWAAEMVLRFRRAYPHLTLEAAIPCPRQDARWSADERAYYAFILGECDSRVTLCPSYQNGCMTMRNHYMVDHAQLLIAAYAGGGGGTRQTLDYALAQGLRVVNIFEKQPF